MGGGRIGEAQPGTPCRSCCVIAVEMLCCWNPCNFISMATSWSLVSNLNKELSGRWYFLRHLCWPRSGEKICSGSRDEKDNKPRLLSLMVFCESSEKVEPEPPGLLG